MSITTGIETYDLKKLRSLSRRSKKQIFDDVVDGKLKACIRTMAIEGQDHIKREFFNAENDGEWLRSVCNRVVWLSAVQAAELTINGTVTIHEAQYPRYIDCVESPPIKRYKVESVIFPEPYTAKISELRFLDGDAIHYIAKHAGATLASVDALEALPRVTGGGSYIVYRLLLESETAPQSNEVPKPLQRSAALQKAILHAIQKLPHNPHAMPKSKPGKAGVRKQVQEYLASTGVHYTESTFKKAWQALRDTREIIDANPTP